MDIIEKAQYLQKGLLAWRENDPCWNEKDIFKVYRDHWDKRIGDLKFGGVWSIDKAKKNIRHPASIKALSIERENWCGKNVTVEHAIPMKILFKHFLAAKAYTDFKLIIDSYNVAVITKEEDKTINKQGLRYKMPSSWYLGDDPLIRWQLAGIKMPEIIS